MKTGVVIAVVLLTALAEGALAAAPVARDDVIAGPELAGSRVVWGSTEPGGGLVVRAAAPGVPPTTLFAFAPLQRPSTQTFGAIAASATHLAMLRVAVRESEEPGVVGLLRAAGRSEIGVVDTTVGASATLVAGPLGGPFTQVAGRRGPPRPGRRCQATTVPAQPVLSGSVLAYAEVETTCTRSGARMVDRVVVRDLARPGSAPRVVATGRPYVAGGEPKDGLGAVRIAGRYVAWQVTRNRPNAESTAKVFDLRRGRVVHTVDRGPAGSRGDVLEWFDVAPDGTLVISFHDETAHALAVSGGDDDGLVEMRPAPGARGYEPSTTGVSYRRGRIAFVARTGPGEYGLVLTRRTGTAAPLARFDALRPSVGDPAWNGRYAAWASGRGAKATLWRSGPHG